MFRIARRIVNDVCYNWGITEDVLEKGGKTRTISACRQEIVQRLRKETNLSWAEIAAMVGRKTGFRGADRVKVRS